MRDYEIHRGILNNSVKGKLFECFTNIPEHGNTMCMYCLPFLTLKWRKASWRHYRRGIWKTSQKKNRKKIQQ